MKTKNFSFKPAVLLLLALMLFSYACTEIEDDSRSSSLLVVDSVEGEPGGAGGVAGDVLLSDVCDNPDDQPQDPEFCSVFNDNATITFSNQFLQIAGGIFQPTFMNDIVVNRYRVDYFRSNNRNTPGIDVPFPIDGSMNVRIPVNGRGSVSILVVRHEAKSEPPLAELSDGPSEGVLTANAQMQFFGHDIAGHEVKATGFLEIHFANFGEGQ
jgi:hypothetical protein